MKLQDWTKVYPVGTPEGEDEYKFFIALTRSKYAWRSTDGIAEDTGLSPKRVEEIIQKYIKLGLVYPHPTNDGNWGYWQNIPEKLLPQKSLSLVQKDHQQRINKAKNG